MSFLAIPVCEFSKRYGKGLSAFLVCKVDVVILYSKVFHMNKSVFTFLKVFQEKKDKL